MSLMQNQPFDFSVSLRVAWSLFWRMVLIGVLFGIITKLILPPSAIELQIRALTDIEPAPSFAEIQAYLETIDYMSMAYAYHMFKTLLPIFPATIVAASFVFKKTYRRFSLRVVDLNGQTISTRWMPALCIACVFLLPTAVIGVGGWLLNVIVPDLATSPIYIWGSVAVGFALFYNAHLAVHWPYRHFRVLVEPRA